jgi:hypothetical protein
MVEQDATKLVRSTTENRIEWSSGGGELHRIAVSDGQLTADRSGVD